MERIYLDYNATALLAPEVLVAMTEVYRQVGNPSSVHQFGKRAKLQLEGARSSVLAAVQLPESEYGVIFTASGTESNNIALSSFATVMVSSIEHLSVSKLSNTPYAIVTKTGEVDLGHVENLLSQGPPDVVSVMYANNETGVIQPLEEIISMAHRAGSVVHTDAVQPIGKVDLNWGKSPPDLLTISAHKFGGPLGAAALIYRKKLKLRSISMGGGQEFGLRAGTQNVPAIVGMSVACDILPQRIRNHIQVQLLRDRLEEGIKKICPQAVIFGSAAPRLPNTSAIMMPEVRAETQVIHCDLENIAISSGAACSSGRVESSHVYSSMGCSPEQANCVIRVSLGPENTENHVESFVNTWSSLYHQTHGGRS